MSSAHVLIIRELQDVFAQLPQDAEERAVQSILSHRRIFVCAAGRSGLMLKAFAMRLAQLGMTAYVAGETVTPAIGRGDLLFLASASGTTYSVCHNAETARKAGADLFIITATLSSSLTAIHPADVYLPCGSKDNQHSSTQYLGSLFEQALLIFCDGIVQNIPGNREEMRQRHANLE